MEPRADNNRQGCREPAAAEGQQLQGSSAGWVAAFIGMQGEWNDFGRGQC